MLCRSTTNLNKRIELLESSVYKSLKTDVKEKMVRQPYAGLVSVSLDHSLMFCGSVSDGATIGGSTVVQCQMHRFWTSYLYFRP